jgi:D-glycero-alpha-D-manno-heptose 1-phosphate guanylyltransferase
MTVAVILAGGLGTRLRSAVPDLPKPMADVQGRPFLEYLLNYWARQGISKFVLSVGYKRESIVNYFGRSFRGLPIEYIEEEEPLGTGGGLLLASRQLHQPFMLLNGDTFFEVQLNAILDFHRSVGSKWSFALFRANEAGRYGGVNLDSSDRVRSLNTAKGDIGELANGGVYLVDPHALNSANFKVGDKYSLEEDVIPTLLEMDIPFFGFESEGQFLDIGVPTDYFRAADVLPQFGDR